MARTIVCIRFQSSGVADPKGIFHGSLRLEYLEELDGGESMAAYADGLNPSTAIPEMELVAQITPAADLKSRYNFSNSVHLHHMTELVLKKKIQTSFKRLVHMQINKDPRLGPCIILCGRGTPDLSTRQLANRLSTHEELVKRGVSTYIISDANPYGYSITFCYKYGSWALQFYEGLTSRNAIRIGVTPMDWNELS
ncbi:hypothetical protein MJO28_003400 [Puccinia striiformis f. sp. tritici]|uniref:Uncharacterized protein n=1 Tax=Puccinia striiformis f. sp. tritici TaxID=168172 RepID=A0ACC0ET64_9BASI|nr:hypothetical protein MJO28_003400 [Puccinia striiformis f. sp. tritici]